MQTSKVPAQVEQFEDKVRETRLKWFGQSRDSGYIGQRVLNMEEKRKMREKINGHSEGGHARVTKEMICSGSL